MHFLRAGQNTGGRDGDQRGAANGLPDGAGGLRKGGGVVITSDKNNKGSIFAAIGRQFFADSPGRGACIGMPINGDG